jgi:hypothetical protein
MHFEKGEDTLGNRFMERYESEGRQIEKGMKFEEESSVLEKKE